MLLSILPYLFSALLVSAHGEHGHEYPPLGQDTLSYAERHMQSEHHIDNFDLESFFIIHDLNLDGVWDELEIKAIYGLYHPSVLEKIPQEDLQEARAVMIVGEVLKALDKDGDGKISMAEYVAGGKDGLPSFVGFQDLGHHYDEESEYFLHHEELYHSTPETQTDEAYNHPEDIEHFKHHQKIEEEEDARERIFEGLPADADLSQDHKAPDPLDIHAHAPGEGPAEGETMDNSQIPQIIAQAGEEVAPPPKRPIRADPGASPNRLVAGAVSAGHEDRHDRIKSADERMRAGLTYKNKFRKGLRADEF